MCATQFGCVVSARNVNQNPRRSCVLLYNRLCKCDSVRRRSATIDFIFYCLAVTGIRRTMFHAPHILSGWVGESLATTDICCAWIRIKQCLFGTRAHVRLLAGRSRLCTHLHFPEVIAQFNTRLKVLCPCLRFDLLVDLPYACVLVITHRRTNPSVWECVVTAVHTYVLLCACERVSVNGRGWCCCRRARVGRLRLQRMGKSVQMKN